MRCDPSSVSSDDAIPVANEKKQLSFVYQPGIGLYDKKKSNSHERTQALVLSQLSSDVDQQCSSTNIASEHAQKSYLRRQNEQDLFSTREKLSSDKDSHYHLIELFDENTSANQENNQKRKFDRKFLSNKKPRPSSSPSHHEEVSHPQTNVMTLEGQPGETGRPRSKSKERLSKQPITSIIKNIPMVKKLSSENYKDTPSQGLLLCPKDEQISKKKKKKIAPTIASHTALLDDDSVLDSILFNDMQSVQQQWQQFLTLTMEKELHIHPSDGKKKFKTNKFHRTNDFFLAYDNLYDFEGMKHWYPTLR